MIAQFEILDSTNNWDDHTKPPVVRISRRGGTIRFSVQAVKQLGLKPGMRLSFMMHTTDNDLIYICKSPTGLELKMEDTKSRFGAALYCCARKHTPRLLNYFNMPDNSKTFDITNNQTEANGQQCWFISKSKIHKPIKWRKK